MTYKNKRLMARIITTIIVGALALVLADIAARTLVAPQELATGAMTALVGAPLFIFIAARFFK